MSAIFESKHLRPKPSPHTRPPSPSRSGGFFDGPRFSRHPETRLVQRRSLIVLRKVCLLPTFVIGYWPQIASYAFSCLSKRSSCRCYRPGDTH